MALLGVDPATQTHRQFAERRSSTKFSHRENRAQKCSSGAARRGSELCALTRDWSLFAVSARTAAFGLGAMDRPEAIDNCARSVSRNRWHEVCDPGRPVRASNQRLSANLCRMAASNGSHPGLRDTAVRVRRHAGRGYRASCEVGRRSRGRGPIRRLGGPLWHRLRFGPESGPLHAIGSIPSRTVARPNRAAWSAVIAWRFSRRHRIRSASHSRPNRPAAVRRGRSRFR